MVQTAFLLPHSIPGLLTYWNPLPHLFLVLKGRMILAWGLGNITQKKSEQEDGLV